MSDDSLRSKTMTNFFCDVVQCLGTVRNRGQLSRPLSNIIKASWNSLNYY